MIKIDKLAQPVELTAHQATPNAGYNGWPSDAIRSALIAEQGGLCAYCMNRIKDDSNSTRIEHFKSRKENKVFELNWGNLLACCNGNKGHFETHCDVAKGDKTIHYNPAAEPDVAQFINYNKIGFIDSENQLMKRQIEILNLNQNKLVGHRKSIYDNLIKALTKGGFTPAVINQKLNLYHERNNEGLYNTYKGVAIYWLSKRLAKLL
jgi:uncharacterized protein (TIGR02646 family)